MKRFQTYFIIGLLWLSLLPARGAAQQVAIENGVSYLYSTQSSDGRWTSPETTDYFATAEVLTAITATGNAGINYTSGISWFSAQMPDNIDYLANRLTHLKQTDDLNALLSYRIQEGGWGTYSGYATSAIADTTLALLALKSANYTDTTTISSVINYLTANQNTDGGFGFSAGDSSNTYMTSMVSYTLQQFPQTTFIATAVNKVTTYLATHQNVNGGFGAGQDSGGASAAPTVYETALAYIALVGVTTDNTVLGNAVNYITSTQSSNGSWNDDPYSTALALRALYFSQNKPTPPPAPPAEITPVNENPSARETTITGKVTDAATGAPITGAYIAVSGTTGLLLTAKTDAAGTYSISGVSMFEFSVKASATGYDTLTYNVTTTSYGRYTVDAALNQSKASMLKITSLTTDKESYTANVNCIISAEIENTGSGPVAAMIVAHINDDKGNTVALAYPADKKITVEQFSQTALNITWNTGQLSPGKYQAVFKAADPDIMAEGGLAGAALVEKAIPFAIEPYVGMSDISIKLQPGYTHIGAEESVNVGIAYTNTSNTPADLTAEYSIKTPAGVVVQSGTAIIPLSLDVVTTTAPIGSFLYTFNESGDYPVEVTVYRDGIELYRISSVFTVQSNIRIDLSRSVTPQTLVPDGNGKVRIIIDLKGVEIK